MAPLSLLQCIILVCQGELLFLWGVVIYSLVWYTWAYGNGPVANSIWRFVQLLVTVCLSCAQWAWSVAENFAEWAWPIVKNVVHILAAFLVLLAWFLYGLFRPGQPNHRTANPSAGDYRPTAPAYAHAISQTPLPVAACPVPQHYAYSFDHETNLLDDINSLLGSINHPRLLDAASDNDQASRELLTAKERVQRSFVFLRDTAILDLISNQGRGSDNKDYNSVQSAISSLESHRDACLSMSSRVLGKGGTAGLLAHEIAALSHEAQLGLDQPKVEEIHSQQYGAMRAKPLLGQASERLDLLKDMLSGDACFATQIDVLVRDWHIVSRGLSTLEEEDMQNLRRLRSYWPTITIGLQSEVTTAQV